MKKAAGDIETLKIVPDAETSYGAVNEDQKSKTTQKPEANGLEVNEAKNNEEPAIKCAKVSSLEKRKK